MCSAGSAWTLLQTGCPIRIPPDHRLLPTPRRFSQVAASFFGAWCLGIHLGPLVACPAYDHSSIPCSRATADFSLFFRRGSRLAPSPIQRALGFSRREFSNFLTYSVDKVLQASP